MAYVDPERFKRFEQFLARHLPAFAMVARRGFAERGPGVVIYRASDDKFEPPTDVLKFEYKPRAQIDSAQKDAPDTLIGGMLERYQPPEEALLVAIYPDNSYDVSRVKLPLPRPPKTASN